MIKLRIAKDTDTHEIRELLKKWLIETKLNFGQTNNSKASENILEYNTSTLCCRSRARR